MCPHPESNWQPFSARDNVQPMEPRWPEQEQFTLILGNTQTRPCSMLTAIVSGKLQGKQGGRGPRANVGGPSSSLTHTPLCLLGSHLVSEASQPLSPDQPQRDCPTKPSMNSKIGTPDQLRRLTHTPGPLKNIHIPKQGGLKVVKNIENICTGQRQATNIQRESMLLNKNW